MLYCKEGQCSENEMFGNEHSSPQFEEFLHFIGSRIRLKGWAGFNGGLDTERTSSPFIIFSSFSSPSESS